MSTSSEGAMPRHHTYILHTWETRSAPPDPASRWRFSLQDVRTGKRHKFPNLASLSAFLEDRIETGENVTEIVREPEKASIQEIHQDGAPAPAEPKQERARTSDLLVEDDEALRDQSTTEAHEAIDRTVVCIEDEPDMISLIRLALERHRVRLIGALGGREGLDRVRQVQPDLVLLDLMMPDINGAEVLQRMRADESLRDIPVIVITVLDPRYTVEQGLDLQRINGFIRKPFMPQELVDTVNSALQPVA